MKLFDICPTLMTCSNWENKSGNLYRVVRQDTISLSNLRIRCGGDSNHIAVLMDSSRDSIHLSVIAHGPLQVMRDIVRFGRITKPLNHYH
jgi:hypothetical protein